ncbi:hypothetical protein ACP70R_004141 [Stipagrostis hirtigluma subsp. patula]
MATAAADAASSRWPDLPLDLLHDISSRLHAAADFVRFHAVCKPWRDTLRSVSPRPGVLLPWLLAPCDDTGHRAARCFLSSSKSNSRAAAAAIEVRVRDRRWVIRVDDGAAAWLLTASPDDISGPVDPLTGSAAAKPLPGLPDAISSLLEYTVGAVAADGTVFLYSFVQCFKVVLLRPGDQAWTLLQRKDLYVYSEARDRACVACHGGRIVVCVNNIWSIVSTDAEAEAGAIAGVPRRSPWRVMPDEPGNKFLSSYIVESRGELLWVSLQVSTESAYYKDINVHYRVSDAGSLVSALSVSVYTLRAAEDAGEPRWTRTEGRSLADRVLFLGRPVSFAVDAARLGMSGGGCAYFVLWGSLYARAWSKSPVERCRLFKYSFHDGTTELVEQLPEQWNGDDACMWITPHPAIAAPIKEIRERLKPLDKKAVEPQQQFGAYFKMYVGNLPRKVDSYRLRQFFSQHGKVADARVMHERKTSRSRGFGFVTMAIAVDEEPAHAIAKLDGQSLDGRPLKVKSADQEH